jgi:hypothetical protein
MKNQINLLIYLLGKISKCSDQDVQPNPVMTRDEAYTLWDEIDKYRFGSTTSSSLQRWLQEFADFNFPFEEIHYLFDCFDVRETEGKITQ